MCDASETPLVVFSGPSGVGKDTLVSHVLRLRPETRLCVSCTTRRPRNGEVDGIDYHFVTQGRFDELVARDLMLEHQTVHGNSYGTPKSEVSRLRENGLTPLLILDTKGFTDLRRRGVECLGIFVMPPSAEELERRLRSRGTDDEATIALRMRNAKQEIKDGRSYDIRVVNDDVESCARKVIDVLDHL